MRARQRRGYGPVTLQYQYVAGGDEPCGGRAAVQRAARGSREGRGGVLFVTLGKSETYKEAIKGKFHRWTAIWMDGSSMEARSAMEARTVVLVRSGGYDMDLIFIRIYGNPYSTRTVLVAVTGCASVPSFSQFLVVRFRYITEIYSYEYEYSYSIRSWYSCCCDTVQQ